MSEQFEDDRINRKRVYSISLIENAFMDLLEDIPFERITVTDVCKKANINRSTFYSNFTDIYDLVDYLTRAPLRQLRELVKRYDTLEEKQLYEKLFTIYSSTNLHRLYGLVPAQKESDDISEALYDLVVRTRMGRTNDPVLLRLAYVYATAGSLQLLREWSNSDKKIPPEKMAECMFRFNTACIGMADPNGIFNKEFATGE